MSQNLYSSSNIGQSTPDNELDTRQFFNGHFVQSVEINSSEHQAVKSFFLGKTNGNDEISNTLTDTLFEIGASQNIKVMELVDRLRSDTIDDLQLTLITLINGERKKTSMLGFANTRTPNPSVSRNVIE